MGDIDYHADNPDNFVNFFDFTIEEIKERYQEFLNLTVDGEEGHENPEHEHDQNQTGHQIEDVLHDSSGEIAEKDIENNLTNEYDQTKKNNIEEAFNDFNYWKPKVDYNLDELLQEMGRQ